MTFIRAMERFDATDWFDWLSQYLTTTDNRLSGVQKQLTMQVKNTVVPVDLRDTIDEVIVTLRAIITGYGKKFPSQGTDVNSTLVEVNGWQNAIMDIYSIILSPWAADFAVCMSAVKKGVMNMYDYLNQCALNADVTVKASANRMILQWADFNSKFSTELAFMANTRPRISYRQRRLQITFQVAIVNARKVLTSISPKIRVLGSQFNSAISMKNFAHQYGGTVTEAHAAFPAAVILQGEGSFINNGLTAPDATGNAILANNQMLLTTGLGTVGLAAQMAAPAAGRGTITFTITLAGAAINTNLRIKLRGTTACTVTTTIPLQNGGFQVIPSVIAANFATVTSDVFFCQIPTNAVITVLVQQNVDTQPLNMKWSMTYDSLGKAYTSNAQTLTVNANQVINDSTTYGDLYLQGPGLGTPSGYTAASVIADMLLPYALDTQLVANAIYQRYLLAGRDAEWVAKWGTILGAVTNATALVTFLSNYGSWFFSQGGFRSGSGYYQNVYQELRNEFELLEQSIVSSASYLTTLENLYD